jgi:DNA gyrase subunit B
LSAVLETLTEIEQLGHALARKGIPLQEYLLNRHPETGAFPQYVVTHGGDGPVERRYAHTDAQLKALREELERTVGQQLEIFSDQGQGGPRAPAFRYSEVFQAPQVARLVAKLEKKGFRAEHYAPGKTPFAFLANGDGQKRPVHSLPQLLNMVRELGKKGLEIQRYKGLGEMTPEQLFVTTMDPAARKLLKVVVEDGVKADEIFNVLMGDEVEPRREFIESNALNVKNLDI